MASAKCRDLEAAPLPQGCRAPAPEPSNGEQAGWHTTYPELLELGPGQGGVRGAKKNPTPCRPWSQVPEGLCDFGQASHPLWASNIPHLSKTYMELSGLVGRASPNGRCQAHASPQYQPLTWWTTPSISTGMMKSALFTGCGEKRGAGAQARPAQTALLGQVAPPQKPRAGGCRAEPTLKELCTRVSSRSMTTQILSESWALASGSRYCTGVCCGDERDWLGAPP